MPLSSLAHITRSVLLSEANDPTPPYSGAEFSRLVREAAMAIGRDPRAVAESMRAVAGMIADPAAGFASIESLAAVIVDERLFMPRAGASPEEWARQSAFYWKRALPGNDTDHLRKAIVGAIGRGGQGEDASPASLPPTGGAPGPLRTLAPEELASALELHRMWITSGGGAYTNLTRRGARANLAGVDLRGVDLRVDNTRRAKLVRAILSGSDLRGANLRFADLSGADLTGAQLSGADLAGANLTMSRLVGANVVGARLEGATLTGAVYDSMTVFSPGFDPAARGMVARDRVALGGI